MSALIKRQHGKTWRNVPTIAGSRWGFLGLMIGIFVLLVLFVIALCCCLCRRRSTKKQMDYASTGSNLATTHPEPTYPRLTKPAGAAQMTDAEEGNGFLHHDNMAYPAESHHQNDAYGYHTDGRNDMQQYGYGSNQGYPESHGYHGSNYEQQADEPQFDPVAAPIVPGGYHQNPYQNSSASNSMHHGQMGSAYHQSGYPQAGVYPQPAHSPAPNAQAVHPSQYMNTYPEQSQQAHEQYGQAYSSSSPPAREETPPAYPAGSVEHTHDLPKSRMPPPGM